MIALAQRYVEEASAIYGVSVDEVLGETRRAGPVAARHRVMRQLRADGLSLPEIGRLLQRDHTTVLSALGMRGTGVTRRPRKSPKPARKAKDVNYEGMTVEQAASYLGKPVPKAVSWLKDRGYRWEYSSRVIRRPRTAQEVADEIHARIQAMRPVAPCFRCGVRGECQHR